MSSGGVDAGYVSTFGGANCDAVEADAISAGRVCGGNVRMARFSSSGVPKPFGLLCSGRAPWMVDWLPKSPSCIVVALRQVRHASKKSTVEEKKIGDLMEQAAQSSRSKLYQCVPKPNQKKNGLKGDNSTLEFRAHLPFIVLQSSSIFSYNPDPRT